MLSGVSMVLNVPVEAIKTFSDETAFQYVNTSNNNSTGTFNNYSCVFNPLEKIVELYEALLNSERDKIELLEKHLKK